MLSNVYILIYTFYYLYGYIVFLCCIVMKCKEVKRMKIENYKLRKKLIKTGGSSYLLIPAEWLQEQAERIGVKKVENVILQAYDSLIVIAPLKNK